MSDKQRWWGKKLSPSSFRPTSKISDGDRIPIGPILQIILLLLPLTAGLSD